MKIEICVKCENFIQHYVLSDYFGITSTLCGHCGYKRNNINKKSCEFFKEIDKSKEEQIDIFQDLHRLKISSQKIVDQSNILEEKITNIRR